MLFSIINSILSATVMTIFLEHQQWIPALMSLNSVIGWLIIAALMRDKK